MDTRTKSPMEMGHRISTGTRVRTPFDWAFRMYRAVTLLLCVFTAEFPTGCGGGGSAAIQNPMPTITSVSPSSAFAGDAAFTLSVTGANFVTSSTVQWNISSRTTTFVSSATLQAAINAADLAAASTATVTVSTPAPGGGTSAGVSFTIKAAIPVVTISPSSAIVAAGGQQQFQATVTKTQNTAVTWQVKNITGGSPAVGTISSSGLYIAPIIAECHRFRGVSSR
jgi:hypothetical protein